MPITKPTIRILIIDDDEDDYFITSEYLRQIEEYNLVINWAYKFSDAIDQVQKRAFDIYFVDYRLGAKTGIDFLKEAIRLGCEEPIVLLTGKGNKEIDIEAMQIGATDYLVKTDLNADKLERCIRYALERTAYLKALRANEKKYRSIFELSKDVVFIADKDLYFKDVNAATSELLGYAADELQRRTVYDLIVDEGDKEHLRRILEQEGEVNDLEVEISTSSGDRRIFIFTLTAAVDPDGGSHYQGLMHDITNLRRAEKANLMVEKLGATGRLVRTLAHEVRNPLNNINMSVEQLVGDQVNEEAALFLDIIQRNSKRIGDLITELLDTSRPTEMTFERTTLQAVLDESISEALDRITLQHIQLRVRRPEEPCYLNANKEKLKIAFLNIVINAVEAMPADGSGTLDITVTTEDDRHVAVVRDNGCGIPEENISRLFEPYYTSKRNGMGLGLAATLNILQAHKAQIDVSSAVGQGTTFTISFPAV
ncbi:hybrid sensor histidine kinase/response regulator [Flaviaesturariibacter flavus]|uniref:histidine kinase n=1 Tax=Flaviaesturariibacter flavus TaxID=2502780 RepID=A0A4R1BKA4_9BACT|nr:hybrid sensor histidine kinase/response regulator [Flaviaesturariibacter flavus]TCJ17820.1 hybrid sensor histidine kinase/response regulator [Flaviaesturariibacter flavus]